MPNNPIYNTPTCMFLPQETRLFPTVVVEETDSQRGTGAKNLASLVENCIRGSRDAVKAMISFDLGSGSRKEATFSIWRSDGEVQADEQRIGR